MDFRVGILGIAFVFAKGLHHRLWISDFRRGLRGQGEAELVKYEMVDFLGFCEALHPQLASVGGGDRHVEHLDLAQSLQHAAGTQAGGRLLVVFLKADVQAAGEEAIEWSEMDRSEATCPEGVSAVRRRESIHDPSPPLFAVAGGDFLQHADQGGFVGGLAAHDFVTDG